MPEKRNFVRINKRIRLNYKVIVDRFAAPKVTPNVTNTETISGNGLTFMSPRKIEKCTRLEMTINIPGTIIDAAGEVLSMKQRSPNEFEVVVKFVEIDEPIRDRLVQFILKEGVRAKPENRK